LAREIYSIRARSARFWHSASTSSVGLAKHLANIPVSLPSSFQLLSPQISDYRLLARDDDTDPYHTYLSIAAAALVSPDPAWGLQPLDPLINATHETAKWAKEHLAATPRDPKG
jgi:hypothetical protein